MVDSSTQALGYLLYSSGAELPSGKPQEEDAWLGRDDDILADADSLFDPYGLYDGLE